MISFKHKIKPLTPILEESSKISPIAQQQGEEAISQLTKADAGVSPLRTAANAEKQAHVVEAWDVYVSDFGNFKVIPNRFQRERDCWFLDFDFWAVSYLRPFQTLDIARTGDSKKQELIVEYGLESKNQYASGCMYDVTTS